MGASPEIAAAAERLAELQVSARCLTEARRKLAVDWESLRNSAGQAASWLSDPNYAPVRQALLGAGVGGAIGLGSSLTGRRKRPLSSLASGALAGSLIGGGVGLVSPDALQRLSEYMSPAATPSVSPKSPKSPDLSKLPDAELSKVVANLQERVAASEADAASRSEIAAARGPQMLSTPNDWWRRAGATMGLDTGYDPDYKGPGGLAANAATAAGLGQAAGLAAERGLGPAILNPKRILDEGQNILNQRVVAGLADPPPPPPTIKTPTPPPPTLSPEDLFMRALQNQDRAAAGLPPIADSPLPASAPSSPASVASDQGKALAGPGTDWSSNKKGPFGGDWGSRLKAIREAETATGAKLDQPNSYFPSVTNRTLRSVANAGRTVGSVSVGDKKLPGAWARSRNARWGLSGAGAALSILEQVMAKQTQQRLEKLLTPPE